MDTAPPAKLEYGHGHFRLIWPGSYVVCAVTGSHIALDALRYWSVDRQEAYVSPAAAMTRQFPDGP